MLYSLLRDSLRFYINHVVYLAGIILPFIVPFYLFVTFYQTNLPSEADSMILVQLLPLLIYLLIRPILQAATLLAISAALQGEYPPISSLWQRGWSKWLSIIFVDAMFCAIVFSGLVFFIFPGLYLMARMAFCEILVVVEELDPLTAITESWERTRSFGLTLFGGFAAIFIALQLPEIQLTEYVTSNNIPAFFDEFILSVFFSVLNIFTSVFVYRVYHQTKMNKAG